MKNHSLTALGWSDLFESQLKNISIPGIQPARVTTENKTNYGVRTQEKEFIAEVTGKLMYTALSDSDLPKVGDWVAVTVMDEDRAMIHEVLPRRTVLSRKAVGKTMTEQVIVSNLDVLFIVQGLDDNFNIPRLERYLTAVRNIKPVIVLNKADLCKDPEEKVRAVCQRIHGADVITTSSVDHNIGALKAYLHPGQTFAFAGSSGVGKSSLINSLLEDDRLKTAAVREKDSKGKHTTSRREMIFMENGAILVDTPGMREFQPWADAENVSVVFDDIRELSRHCRFADCQHLHEAGCAVKDAVETGALSAAHYENYLKLRREMEYQESRVDASKALERKNFFKRQIKAYNRFIRKKPKE